MLDFIERFTFWKMMISLKRAFSATSSCLIVVGPMFDNQLGVAKWWLIVQLVFLKIKHNEVRKNTTIEPFTIALVICSGFYTKISNKKVHSNHKSFFRKSKTGFVCLPLEASSHSQIYSRFRVQIRTAQALTAHTRLHALLKWHVTWNSLFNNKWSLKAQMGKVRR